MYSLTFILGHSVSLKIRPKELSKSIPLIIGGIISGFFFAEIISNLRVMPFLIFGQWIVIITFLLLIAIISIVGVYILASVIEIFINIIMNEIALISTIGSFFFFLSLNDNLTLFFIFILVSSLGLTVGYLKRKVI